MPGRKQHIRPDSSEQRNLEQRLAKLDPALRPEDALEPRQRIDARRFGRPQPGVELERTEARLAGAPRQDRDRAQRAERRRELPPPLRQRPVRLPLLQQRAATTAAPPQPPPPLVRPAPL